ncbi:sphingoid long chain base kinase 4 [Pyricularia oryzae 70-15]|uniref:Sphingoid long chain base kinase 4 n=3 Tax=Pyricularia oryzae TaxID=318829 RepID=G4N4Q7_PYRO7|nr:sphingoid long chain base kinase 4 [Pyricularia oryzae 70-15]EHA52872.1 sphingoid long chain base kinase 4 [Pyricularia oryzae 70-15]ELQ38992.1 sphingoid long chain base kinase 4 [Pyricularia oryzae Y34]KAI7927626.1 sphingoid long chain base kinase 4 [Pyricularia oryzae]KAI7930643.1 sphingoid long chain base kinase 4 [Pyricularia oryzae]
MALDGESLALGSYNLSIVGDKLLVNDKSSTGKSKSSRSCFGTGNSATKQSQRTIPLYNILWAEVAGDSLVIDYAEDVSKTKIRPTKITIPLPPATTAKDTTTDAPATAEAGADLEAGNAGAQSSPAARASAWASSLLDHSYDPSTTRRKRAFVIINPHAGPGGAMRKFETQVRPIFLAARMELEIVTTTRRGEAEEIVQKLDLDKYDVIAVASGDGLVYETFNGLGRRPDAQKALKSVAVVHIPCGSGNAMACNLYGTHRVSPAALAAVKGVPTALDLVSVTQGNTRTLSFLSQALGVIAESDLGTDNLRWMGSARFTYGYITRAVKRAVYPCDISVKVEIDDKAGIKEHYARHRPDRSSTAPVTKADSVVDGDVGTEVGEGLPPLKYGTINDKVPEGWETFSYDNMGQLYCGNMAYIMPDSNIFSAACINDGMMDLVTVDGDISPFKSLELMTLVESGKFFDDSRVRYRKVSAYRITPRNQASGYISIDGEGVPFAPFQCEIHRGLGLVLSKAGTYEAPGPMNWEKVAVNKS